MSGFVYHLLGRHQHDSFSVLFFSFNTFGINVCLGQLPLLSVSPEFVFSVLRVWNLLKDQLTYKTHFELSATGSML